MATAIRRTVELVLMLAGLLALPVAWMHYRDAESKRAAEPPPSVRTLDDFRKWRPHFDQAIKLETRGMVYYLIFGEKARLLASGPSGYVFDARGTLVGWILDTGDATYWRISADSGARYSAIGAGRIVINPASSGDQKN